MDQSLETFELTKSQKKGEELFHEWFVKKGFKKKQILRIGGGGGFGKTYFIKYIMQKYKLTVKNCMVVAYTGQAVNVLRQNDIKAKTIHSSFMEAVEVPLKIDGKVVKKRGIPITTIRFKPIKFISSKIKLIIVDESSFLPEELEKLITSFNLPVLETGDPFQLPPVIGKQVFTTDTLDLVFTDPMRQSKDSEIFDLATRIRNGDRIDISKYHDQVLFLLPQKTVKDTFYRYKPFFKYAQTIITTNNKQREVITELYRKEILKTDSPYPLKGEKLICRKNNWMLQIGDYPLTNGTIGTVLNTIPRSQIDRKNHTFYMDFKPDYIDGDYYDNLLCDFDYLSGPFGADKVIDKFNEGEKFEFAHAITTHLAQGSTVDSAVFVDGYNHDAEYMRRLRYTAVTRAKKRLVYILP